MKKLSDRFEQFNDSYLTFEKVSSKLSQRADLHAFLLLDKILPGNSDVVSAAEHDEIYLDIDCGQLNNSATDEQIEELVRCGVRYDDDNDSLCMFV